jgi:signal transduction histidine kinase
MNPHLAGILFTNLLSNAIKYNINGGNLYITLKKKGLTIANSGDPLTIPSREVFERFKKGDSPDSVGLGLAIVKKIVNHCGFTIQYDYSKDLHTFSISFEKIRVEAEELET